MTGSTGPMTGNAGPSGRGETRPSHRAVALSVLRVVASAGALVTLYYWLPLSHSLTWAAVVLSVGLVVFIALVAVQARSILRSPFPRLRAVEALATSIPLFLLLFASFYYVLARHSSDAFTEPLTRTNALYFTVTVFSTVGFGDITPKSQVARLVVTGQMITDLIILGLGIKIIVGAVQRRRQPEPGSTGTRS
jgi:voltage-gated potassium channel